MKFVVRSFLAELLSRLSQKALEVSIPSWYHGSSNALRPGLTLVYLHGFNSAFSTGGEKIAHLSKLAPVIGLNYNSFGTYGEIMDSLEGQVEHLPQDLEDLVFVGTSLGAFYAAELGRVFDRPSIIINPCVTPYTMLGFALHMPMTNFVTGVEDSFTMASKASYLRREVNNKVRYLHKPLLLVDLEDELLPAAKIFNTLDFPKVAFTGGCHRFSHMEDALDPISHYINACDIDEVT